MKSQAFIIITEQIKTLKQKHNNQKWINEQAARKTESEIRAMFADILTMK